MTTNKIIMTKGLPASGKSTWAKKQVEASNGAIKRVNKDDLRAMIDAGAWSKGREKEILKVRDALIREWLGAGYSVIVDDTNLSYMHELKIRDIAKEFGVPVEIEDFTYVPLVTCIERDAARANSVGLKVITKMYYSYLFDYSKWVIAPCADGAKPAAIIVDIDGTMAIHVRDGRSPYDLTKVTEDLFNEKLWSLIKYTPYKVIFLSGREGTEQCKQDTIDWMHYHTKRETTSNKYSFFFREEGDSRPDNEIKKEIYEGKIEPYYNIVAVYDDRDQVVSMWRQLGLFTCQVNYGGF